MNFKYNHRAAACTVLLKEAGPEIASKYTSKYMEKQSFLYATSQTKCSSSTDLWVHEDSELAGFV